MQRLPVFFLLLSFCFLFSCTSTPAPSLQTALYVYRFNPPSLLHFSESFQFTGEIPFSVPPQCGFFNLFSPPVGAFLAIELSCPNGQTVLFFDTETQTATQPIRDSDSHFLAWTHDGSTAYLKVDSLGSPRVVRASTDGRQEEIPVAEFTYDLTSSIKQAEITFTFSGGLGQGSELWFSSRDGRNARQLYVDPLSYISFTRFSPDGTLFAFIKIPDTQTPFTVGELWVMDRNGANAHKLADADAGHGYAASWSPDGKQLAFVVRMNPEEERADRSTEALVSNIFLVQVESGALEQVTFLENGRVETPFWSPDGNTLAFNTVINDRMEVHIADLRTGEIRPLLTGPACCPAWMRK